MPQYALSEVRIWHGRAVCMCVLMVGMLSVYAFWSCIAQ